MPLPVITSPQRKIRAASRVMASVGNCSAEMLMSDVFHFGLAEYCLPFSAGTPSPLRSPEGKHGRRRELNLRAAVSVPANRSERSLGSDVSRANGVRRGTHRRVDGGQLRCISAGTS
jgi:hypothetical protein